MINPLRADERPLRSAKGDMCPLSSAAPYPLGGGAGDACPPERMGCGGTLGSPGLTPAF